MTTPFKPDAYTSISPYLIVDGALRTITFLEDVFNAVCLRQIPGAAGTIVHAEIRIDDSIVMLTDGAPGWPPIPAHVHVYVEDVDKTYARALRAGASPVQEPVRKGDENKRGAVKDNGGTTWWISTKVG